MANKINEELFLNTLLSIAMLTAIERSECFMFIESENSTTLKDGLSDCSLSPWIYQESMYADILPQVIPSRFDNLFRLIRGSYAMVEFFSEGRELQIRHKQRTDNLRVICVDDLEMMKFLKGLECLNNLYLQNGIIEKIR